jgi:TetR/AcrR family transcriptional repressor of nem operon
MVTAPRHPDADTPTRILDVAERLVQQRGFNGFSYADVASELNVTRASLHYHFAGKAELGKALIDRYASGFSYALADVDQRVADAPSKLDAYAELYADVLRRERMCLCGMLAAEYETLPPPMRAAVIQFFDDNEVWVRRVLEQGEQEGTLQLDGATSEIARTIVSALQGAMLVARPYGDVARFQATADRLLTGLRVDSLQPGRVRPAGPPRAPTGPHSREAHGLRDAGTGKRNIEPGGA